MLTFGIPGNAVIALMIGALIIHGIQPGPQGMTERPTRSASIRSTRTNSR
jgi:putative tricarboxylic transport membrane protein